VSLYRVKSMVTDEKRIDSRVESSNLLSYVCLDENNHEMMQGMGRTLNVSEGGILLETHVALDPQYSVSLTIALEDDLMVFKGKITHLRKREDGKCESGIEFIEMDEVKRRFFRQYILIFKDQDKII
jgi:c-di-GMP-binding flagellar brake protein YcgR